MRRMEQYFRRALDNITTHGDTDVMPYPIENTIFFDCKDEVLDLLLEIDKNFEDWVNTSPPHNENHMAPVGYTGFRWCTQMDPLWNAYLLGIVISIGEQIESARIPISDRIIFSYRFIKGNHNKLFDTNFGWQAFHKRSIELGESSDHVVICDISDFYQRIRHHRLENALKHLDKVGDIPKKIITLLSLFSNTYSHGLPVGGPAARLLSECVLNQTDQLLRSEGIQFCRFVDDYHLFTSSEAEAYDVLLFLSKKLQINEGLTLQKAKTRIMSSSEFKHTSPLIHADHDEINDSSPRAFLSLTLRFDPYSPTAEEDYESLKAAVAKFDIIKLLQKEIAKSRIDINVTRQIIKSLKYLSDSLREQTVLSVCDSLDSLYPIFPTVVIVFKDIWPSLSVRTQSHIGKHFRDLFSKNSILVKTDINQSYALRLLANENKQENIELLQRLYSTAESLLIKRDIILAMFNYRYTPWISDLRSQYSTFHSILRRAFIIASYSLGDEGRHWRDHNKKNFSKPELQVQKWAQNKASQHQYSNWQVPL